MTFGHGLVVQNKITTNILQELLKINAEVTNILLQLVTEMNKIVVHNNLVILNEKSDYQLDGFCICDQKNPMNDFKYPSNGEIKVPNWPSSGPIQEN